MPEVIYSSLFGELTRQVQIRFDAASEMNKRIFDNVIYERFLDWDDPTIGLDIEEIIGQYNITIAAPTIGDNSKEPIIGSEGLATLKERIVNHALSKPMTMKTYRKILAILDSKMITDEAKKQRLIKIMWGEVMTVVNAIHAKLDMIFLGALSNEGKFELNEKTNPEGGVRGLISFNQPEANIAASKTQWTDANIETVDCFEDIQAILDAAQDKVEFEKILCAPSRVSYMQRSKKLKQMILALTNHRVCFFSVKSTSGCSLTDSRYLRLSNVKCVFRTAPQLRFSHLGTRRILSLFPAVSSDLSRTHTRTTNFVRKPVSLTLTTAVFACRSGESAKHKALTA